MAYHFEKKNYEQAFFNFDPLKISQMNEDDIERLMQNKGIVRNRLKINSIIKNARSYLSIEQSGISFSDFIWQFVEGKTTVNCWESMQEVPVSTAESDCMAKALATWVFLCGYYDLLCFYASRWFSQ